MNAEELKALHSLLSRPGMKVDVSEIEVVIQLKNRLAEEYRKASSKIDAEVPKATIEEAKLMAAKKIAQAKADSKA